MCELKFNFDSIEVDFPLHLCVRAGTVGDDDTQSPRCFVVTVVHCHKSVSGGGGTMTTPDTLEQIGEHQQRFRGLEAMGTPARNDFVRGQVEDFSSSSRETSRETFPVARLKSFRI